MAAGGGPPGRDQATLSPADAPARFVPRYYEIEQSLRTRIATLRPNDPLPSDAMLCREFGVSRMTARNAVQRLTQEGMVYRVPGRGTFVAEAPVHRQASTLLSFSEEMRRRGRRPSSRLLARRVRDARPAEAAELRLADGERVVEIHRLRLADDEPLALEGAVLPAPRVAGAVMEADLERHSLHRALVAAGHRPTAGRANLGAAAAGAEEARLLGLRRGAPLLVERRLIHDQDGHPLELTESRYAGERYGLEVQFDVER